MENTTEKIEEWVTQSQSIGKLMLALSKAQGIMSGASKSSDNPFFKTKYADLHECLEAAREALSTNDLAVVQTTDSVGKDIIIITTLGHSSGEWIRGRLKMTPKKDDDQGRGSSITYGRRYGFSAIVGLAQKDDDGNGSVGGYSDNKGNSQQEQEPIYAKLHELEKGIDWFFKNNKTPEQLTTWFEGKKADVEALNDFERQKAHTSFKNMITELTELHSAKQNTNKLEMDI